MLLHLVMELDLQDQETGLLQLVMDAATLTTSLNLVHHPPSILLSVALDCTLLLLLAPHSPLEAQGPPNICPPSSHLLLCLHHKVSLIHSKHRASPTTQHHPSQKQRWWELSDPKMRKRMMMISLSTTYYMPRAQLPIYPSITHLLSNYPNHSNRLGMRKARVSPMTLTRSQKNATTFRVSFVPVAPPAVQDQERELVMQQVGCQLSVSWKYHRRNSSKPSRN